MAAVKGKNTLPEIFLRQHLHKAGFRYRLHAKGLPGKPDLVFPKRKAVLFIHGCFWHGHGCHRFSWPKTREEFWRKKITGNMERDLRQQNMLRSLGWRVGIVWSCALQGKAKLSPKVIIDECAKWLNGPDETFVLQGRIDRNKSSVSRP
ncbi:very short patch repair endonuclease [Hoeflea sp. AS60]|uniref:very short patch repair endonuclease n=1 Tax=Hoeflea sp. AS60 TaxID=3135780 RepID=UPI00316E1524